jgi:hypothetical protein
LYEDNTPEWLAARAQSVIIDNDTEAWKGTEVAITRDVKKTLRAGVITSSKDFANSVIRDIGGIEASETGVWRAVENEVELLLFGIYPGSKHQIPRPLDAVFYFINDEEEVDREAELDALRLFSDKIWYVINKAVVARESAEVLAFALEVRAPLIRINSVSDFIEHISSVDNELTQRISTVFNAFDRDNSGFLDIKEIEQVSSELGHSVTSIELERLFAEVDENGDGQISLSEFTNWYKSGRVGSNKLFRNLTSKIAKTKGSLKNAGAELQRALGDEDAHDDKIDFHLKAHHGTVESSSVQVEVHAVAGKIDELETLAADAGATEGQTVLILSFESAETLSAEELEQTTSNEFAKLVSLVSTFDPMIDSILQSSRLTVRSKGNRIYVILAMNLDDIRPIKTFLKDVTVLINACKFEQSFHFKGAWDIDASELFDDRRNAFENFIEDFTADISVTVWRRYRDLIANSRQFRKLKFLQFVGLTSGDVEVSVEGLSSLPEFIFRKINYSDFNMSTFKKYWGKTLKKQLPLVCKTLNIFSEHFKANFEVFAKVSSISASLKASAPGLSSFLN